jgi:hypothetical protein
MRSVSLGTTPLEVLEWYPSYIHLKVPSPIPSGEVQVAIGSRKSQPVRVTEWLIPFTYSLVGEGTLQYTLKLNCRLRGDVRGFRNLPEEVPYWVPIGTWALEDTDGSLNVSGELRDAQGVLQEAWTGGLSLRWLDPGHTNPLNYVTCSGAFDQPSSSLYPFAVGGTAQFSRGPAGNGTAFFEGIAVPIRLTMDWQTRRINGGTIAVPGPLSNRGVSATLSWPEVLPVNPPTDDDGH